MGKKKTPLLQKLRENGATMYVFPSASEDIGLNVNSNVNGVALSHYALLDLPEVNQTSTNQLGVYMDGEEGVEPSVKIAESLQNYLMNFETTLINQDSYSYQELKTVSEKAFWHWMMHIGAIDFIQSDNEEDIYREPKQDEDQSYKRVVQCFGAIDAGNSLSTEFGMFNETYINIPTSYGNGPVYFKRVKNDPNYQLGQTYQTTTGNEWLEGRDQSDGEFYSYLPEVKAYPDSNDSYTYSISQDKDAFEIVKDVDQICQILQKDYDDKLHVFTYDNINVDVNHNFSDVMRDEFEFNAILLFYSVYDQNDMNKLPQATNLFGIVFLDSPQGTQSSFYIPRHVKKKSSDSNFGNGFSFRVNIKTMSVYDNTDAVIQDNTTLSSISSNDFSDAISQLNRAINIMNTNAITTSAIQTQYQKLITFYGQQQTKIDSLETALNSYIKGTHSSILDTSVLYANMISPSLNNGDNTLQITVQGEDSSLLKMISVTSSGVDIPYLSTQTVKASNFYVIPVIDEERDQNILSDADMSLQTVNSAIETCDAMFEQPDQMIVKLSYEGQDDKVYNRLYIDPSSPLLSKDYSSSMSHLSCLKSETGEVDYVMMIPYIIAYLQKVNSTVGLGQVSDKIEEINDSLRSIVQKLDELSSSVQVLNASVNLLEN